MRRTASILVAASAVYAVVAAAGGVSDAVAAFQNLRIRWVITGVVIGSLRLGCYGAQLHRLTSHLRTPPLVAYALGWVLYGFGAVTPAAPAEGLAMTGAVLQRHGANRRETTIALAFSEWFAQRTFYVVASINLLITAALGDLPLDTQWPLIVSALVVTGGLVLTAFLAQKPTVAANVALVAKAARHPRRPRPPEDTTRVAAIEWHESAMKVVGPPPRRVGTALVSVAAVVADAMTLWCMCKAAALHVGFDVAVLAAAAGTVASWIPLLPGGLGVVEAAIPAVLHASGAPFGAALAATVVYRAAGTLLPALAGATMLIALRRPRSPCRTIAHEP